MKAIFQTKDGLKSYPEKIKIATPLFYRPVYKSMVKIVDADEFSLNVDGDFDRREYELIEIKNKTAYYREV